MFEYSTAKVVCKFEYFKVYKKGYDFGFVEGQDKSVELDEFSVKDLGKDKRFNDVYYAGYLIGRQVGLSFMEGSDYGYEMGFGNAIGEMISVFKTELDDIEEIGEIMQEMIVSKIMTMSRSLYKGK